MAEPSAVGRTSCRKDERRAKDIDVILVTADLTSMLVTKARSRGRAAGLVKMACVNVGLVNLRSFCRCLTGCTDLKFQGET